MEPPGPEAARRTGRLLGHDTFTVQLLDTKEQLRSFMKADLREHGFAPSPMPSFRGTLTPQELADVVSYLASLKAPRVLDGPPGAEARS